MLKEKYIRNKLNGFTLPEVMVTLALTSLTITFAYGTLSYIQKLFVSYRMQNEFILEYINLNQRLKYEELYSDYMIEKSDNEFKLKNDSIYSYLILKKDVILFKKGVNCDTFHLKVEKVKKEYEFLNTSYDNLKLLKGLKFIMEFSDQKFEMTFSKKYDATVKLDLINNVEH